MGRKLAEGGYKIKLLNEVNQKSKLRQVGCYPPGWHLVQEERYAVSLFGWGGGKALGEGVSSNCNVPWLEYGGTPDKLVWDSLAVDAFNTR